MPKKTNPSAETIDKTERTVLTAYAHQYGYEEVRWLREMPKNSFPSPTSVGALIACMVRPLMLAMTGYSLEEVESARVHSETVFSELMDRAIAIAKKKTKASSRKTDPIEELHSIARKLSPEQLRSVLAQYAEPDPDENEEEDCF